MAYLSTIAIAMKKTDYERMYQRAWSLCSDEDDNIYTAFLNEGRENCANRKCVNDKYLFLCWDWIKWYSLEGEFVQDFLEEIEEYDFIRIGEETEDIITHFGTEDMLLDIDRSVHFEEE